jgi:hypothetical protein
MPTVGQGINEAAPEMGLTESACAEDSFQQDGRVLTGCTGG